MGKVKKCNVEVFIKYHEEKLAEAVACKNNSAIACHKGAINFYKNILKEDKNND